MDGSGKSDWRKNSDDSGILKTAEFSSQTFTSSSTNSKSSEFCPYSIRESQLSMEYRYDVLLIYDPDENSYYLDKLMEYLKPQNLEIFDFTRDAPPGLPQRKVLQSALKVCRYTCIVITKKFISNFWLQLRTDMSIQDMLDNEEKMYSVIVVVMDSEVKKADLPLDLATISPLFFSEKFFENRIKLAFSKSIPFPSTQHSSQQKSIADKENLGSEYSHAETARFDSNGINVENSKHIKHTEIKDQLKNRSPCEHGDGTFVMPPSICPTIESIPGHSSSVMHRTISVVVSSTGCREPQETSDSANQKVEEFEKQNFDLVHPSFVEQPMESYSSMNDIFSPTCRSFREDNFSFQSDTNVEHDTLESIPPSQLATTTTGYGPPAFFSISDRSVINNSVVNDSVLTELEISADSLPISVNETTSQSMLPSYDIAVASSSQAYNKNLKLDDDLSCSSLPANLKSTDDGSGSRLSEKKKSRSVRSMFGSRLLKTLSFRQKKK